MHGVILCTEVLHVLYVLHTALNAGKERRGVERSGVERREVRSKNHEP